jgi:hypothetical protein
MIAAWTRRYVPVLLTITERTTVLRIGKDSGLHRAVFIMGASTAETSVVRRGSGIDGRGPAGWCRALRASTGESCCSRHAKNGFPIGQSRSRSCRRALQARQRAVAKQRSL